MKVLFAIQDAAQLAPPVLAYVVSCDCDARGGQGSIRFSKDLADAMRFPDVIEALDYWRKPSPLFPVRSVDGRPNRPLTAYTVVVMEEGEDPRKLGI